MTDTDDYFEAWFQESDAPVVCRDIMEVVVAGVTPETLVARVQAEGWTLYRVKRKYMVVEAKCEEITRTYPPVHQAAPADAGFPRVVPRPGER